MLRLLLLGSAIAAPFVTYGAMKVREEIVVNAAVTAERKAGNTRCAVSIAKMESDHNRQVADAVREANAAAETVDDPKDDADLIAICNRSASCRARGTK